MGDRSIIQYVKNAAIDRLRWDECVRSAPNGLIYGFSFYLDHLAAGWDGLVYGDYASVMPLPWRKKFGLRYLFQPAFVAQCGVFGQDISPALLEKFLQAIPSEFRLWEFPLNQANIFKLPGFHIYERKNTVLSLGSPYEILHGAFQENTKRNIKKAHRAGCTVHPDLPVEEVILQTGQQDVQVKNADLRNFKALYAFLKVQGDAKTYGLRSAAGDLLASCVLFFSHRRMYYILAGNHPAGRAVGASHALIDAIIREHAGHDLLLDFEGSDVEGLSFFYKGFGGVEEKYGAIVRNTLPWFVRLLRKG